MKKMIKNFRPAVFIVTYKKEGDKIEYLLLKRKLHWIGWEFPKGGIDKAESSMQAAKRECFEETGLKPLTIKKFNINGEYNYPKLLKDRPGYIGQTYSLFAVQVNPEKIKLDKKEHAGYAWLDFKSAIKRLTWPNQKKCLRIVNKRLTK